MALLVECPSCKYRNPERAARCRRCGEELARARGKVWWVEYYTPEGRRKRERIGPDRRLAETVLHKRKVEIAEGKFLDKRQEPPKVRLREFAPRYLEWCRANNLHPPTKELRVRTLLEHLGDRYLHELTSWDVERYKAARRREVSESTVNRELTVLRHMFNLAIRWGLVRENPTRGVRWYREPRGRLRFLSEEEIGRLLAACNPRLRDIVLVALNTGMRRGEILRLRWDQVDLERGTVFVPSTKGGEAREIPLNDLLREVFERLRRERKEGQEYVFVNPRTGEPYDEVKRSFGSALRRAGLTGCTFHTLRHTFASHLVMAGVDLVTVKELLGHRSIHMTMRYAHLAPEHKRLAVARMEEAVVRGLGQARGHLYGHHGPRGQEGESPKSLIYRVGGGGFEPPTSGL